MFALVLILLLQAESSAPSEKSILEWIDALSSEVIERRNEALRKLEEAGDAAIPHLQKALNRGEAEFQGRCRELITRNGLQPGARKASRVGVDVPDMMCNPERKKEFEKLAAEGKIDQLIQQDYQWLTYAFDGLLSDDKPVVVGSLSFIHAMIQKRSLTVVSSVLTKGKPDFHDFRSIQSRVDEYTAWAQWWYTKTTRNLVAEWANGPTVETEDWGEALIVLRMGWPGPEEKKRLGRIKSYGKAAYPRLIHYIDAEDTALGTTAVLLLKELTGRSDEPSRVTEANKKRLKDEWSVWLKSQR